MTEQTEQEPTKDYKPAISARKATGQTLVSYAAALVTLVSVLLASPELMAQVLAAVAAYPKLSAWTVGFFGFARFGFAFYRDYQKHKDQAAAVDELNRKV